MDHDQHIDAAERATEELIEAFGGGSFDAVVPTCPDWTMAQLAEHLGWFSCLWAHVLAEGTGREKEPLPDMPTGAAITDWYAGLGRYLVRELRATPPDTEVWTWIPNDKSASFVARRSAHELAIHAFDALLTRGSQHPIEPELAADGIEEIFVMIEAWGPPSGSGRGETLHLHGTDRSDEWLLTMAEDGLRVERAHAKGDLAVRAPVSDLELVLYGRPTIGSVERFGDDAVLDAWRTAFTFQ